MVAFVILHYKSIDDTLACIHSIGKLKDQKKIKIIVVDNGSNQEEDLVALKKEKVDLIILPENLGFAKGNNTGCKDAIEKYHPDFLCVVNSDTVIDQTDFIKRIENVYRQTQFDILGPKILTNDSDSVNPFPAYQTLDEVQKRIRYTKKLLMIYKSPFWRFGLNTYLNVKQKIKKPIHLVNGKERAIGVPLHGCALIFSKKYYLRYPDVFYPDTFLFHEEEFLFYRTKKSHLISVYDPEIELFHKEGRSFSKLPSKKKYQKLIFRNEEILKSLKKLEKVLEEDAEI